MSETNPSSSSSPLPPAASQSPPSAFIIGKSFFKQYYAVLATNPETISRFYKPDTSILSHSFQPSVPAEPKVLTSESNSPIDLFSWACSNDATVEGNNGTSKTSGGGGGISVDFGSGAIDAQETIGGGILLVVTGQMTLPLPSSKPKPFVHTFFLSNSAPAGKKKNFYVHNDILRFISTTPEDNTALPPVGVAGQQQQGEVVSNTGSLSDKKEQQKKEVTVPQDKPQEEEVKVKIAPPAPVDPTPQPPAKVKIVEEKVEKEKDGKRKDETDKSTSNHNKSTKKEESTSKPEKSKRTKSESATDKNEKGNKRKDKDNNTSTTSTSSDPKSKSDGQRKKNTNNTEISSDQSPQQQQSKDEKKKKNKARSRSRKKGRSGSRSASPTHGKNGKSGGKNDDGSSSSSKPKTPGSWASLVAGTGSGSASTSTGASKPSPAAAAAASVASQMTESAMTLEDTNGKEGDKSTKSNQSTPQGGTATNNSPPTNHNESNNTDHSNNNNNKESKPPISSSSKSNSNGPPPPAPQRTPEATLFLKNVSDRTKETEIRAIFEPYATNLDQKILGITLKASSGFCFVDFDAKIVVDTILKDADAMKSNGKQQDGGSASSGSGRGGNDKKLEGNKFVIHGKLLDVGRKVPAEKSGGRRHTYRSSSPGNNAYPKARHPRRNSPRGGNRSGRQHGHGHQDKK